MKAGRDNLIKEIEKKAKCIRRHGINMTLKAGKEGGHLGPGFSIVEIVTTLYMGVMKKDPQNPCWPERDRFVLSKGHGVLGLYPVLAESGYFPLETLDTFEQGQSCLAGHPCMKGTPGIECSTGSLGHGLSIGLGMALAAKIDKKDYDTYVLIGDGEQNEGMIWEAVMAAKQYKTDNLVVIIDRNNMQSDGFSKEIIDMEPLTDKWKSFGWHVLETDGNNIELLLDTFDEAISLTGKNMPVVILMKTIMGKGVDFMENSHKWHGSPPNDSQFESALKQLEVCLGDY